MATFRRPIFAAVVTLLALSAWPAAHGAGPARVEVKGLRRYLDAAEWNGTWRGAVRTTQVRTLNHTDDSDTRWTFTAEVEVAAQTDITLALKKAGSDTAAADPSKTHESWTGGTSGNTTITVRVHSKLVSHRGDLTEEESTIEGTGNWQVTPTKPTDPDPAQRCHASIDADVPTSSYDFVLTGAEPLQLRTWKRTTTKAPDEAPMTNETRGTLPTIHGSGPNPTQPIPMAFAMLGISVPPPTTAADAMDVAKRLMDQAGAGKGRFTLRDTPGLALTDTLRTRARLALPKAPWEDTEPGADVVLEESWRYSPTRNVLVLEPADNAVYKEWLPEPLDQPYAGKLLYVRARLKPAPGSQSGGKGVLQFQLLDSSKHLAQSGNYPLEGDDKDDLRLAPQDKQPSGIVVDSDRKAHTAEQVQFAVVAVEALDTAAFGRIEARCDEMQLVGEVENPAYAKHKHALRLPLDQDEDEVSDWWQDQEQVRGKGLTLDDDDKKDQKREGDTYSIFEEYRGFVVLAGAKRKFVRTKPKDKDLFVYDKDGLVQRWYKDPSMPKGNPADLELHYVNEELMKWNRKWRDWCKEHQTPDPNHRWVNLNTPDKYRRAHAFALVVQDMPNLQGLGGTGDGDVGVSVTWTHYWAKMNNQPIPPTRAGLAHFGLRNSLFVAIRSVRARSASGGNAAMEQLILENAVVHEIGHALGMPHHHNAAGNYDDPYNATGPHTCATRYWSAWEAQHPNDVPRMFRYCRNGEKFPNDLWIASTMLMAKNARGEPIRLLYDDARKPGAIMTQTDGCWNMIDVRTD